MLILSHLIAALASVVLPLLVAIQKGRNGDFDYIYQRTIDYTSSFQVPNVLGFLQPTPSQEVVAPILPLMNVTNMTISQPTTSQLNTQLDEKPAYLNVTGEHSYTAHTPQSVFHTYRQAAFSVVDAWLGISKHVLSVFNGLIRMMEDLKDFSAELHFHHHDFTHASMSRTRKALLIACRSLLWSFGRIVFPLSLVVGMLIQLFAAILFVVSVGLGYYVYTLFQALAKEREDLKHEETLCQQVVAQAETLRKDLDQQVKLLDEKEENLKLRETEGSQLRAQAETLQKHLDQRTKQLIESQEDLEFRETTVVQLRLHTDSLQRDLEKQIKLVADGQEDRKRHERTADQLRRQTESLQQDLDQRTNLLAEGRESLKQQETAAKDLEAHAATLQRDLEQQKQLLKDQRQAIEDFQASSKRQLRDAHAKIASLEEEMQAQLQRHAEGQESALEQAQEEVQRLRAGNKALDDLLLKERQRSYQAQDLARTQKAKYTDVSRRLNAINVSYESQKQSLKQKTTHIDELSSERDGLVQAAKAAGEAAQKLRDSLQKLEIDFTNKVSAMTSLEQQLQEARAQLDRRAAELEMSHSKNNELSQRVKEAESRSQSLEDEVKRLENDLSRKSSAVEASELQVEQLRNASDENALVMANLRDELAALRHEHTEARAKEESLREWTEGLEDDLEAKTSAIETLEAQVEQDRRTLGQKTTDLTNAETRVAVLRQDNEMARARAERLQERVSRLEHELDVKTSSVQAYERNSEHQERVLERRDAELAQALERVKTLKGQIGTLRTDVGNSANERNTEAEQHAVRGDGEDDPGVDAAPEANRFAYEAGLAHPAPPEAPESQEVAEPAEGQEQAPVRRRGHKAKKRRAGKQQAAKRQRIPRRHSFDSHAHKACLRCGGPLPVQVWCIPKELRQAGWEKPAETGMPVRSRRHSLDSLAHRRCPVCGGPLPVEVDFVSRARPTEEDDDGTGGSSTGGGARPQSGQTAVSQKQNSSLAGSTGPTPSHTPLQDESSEVDGARDQAAGQSDDTPSAEPRRRRRQRAKGRKATNEQEHAGELDSIQAFTEAQDTAQSPAPSMLFSRWGPEESTSLRPNLPPPGPSRLFGHWISEGSIAPQPTPPPRPNFPPQPSTSFNPSPSTLFPPYHPPGQNNGIGYNFGQPSRHPFSPSNTGFSPSGFAPSYNVGPTWAPGQRPPPFGPHTPPLFPQSPFSFQAANRGQPLFRPSQPFNPGARDFRPAQPFPFPTPNNNFQGRGANLGPAGPPRDSNVSKWAD